MIKYGHAYLHPPPPYLIDEYFDDLVVVVGFLEDVSRAALFDEFALRRLLAMTGRATGRSFARLTSGGVRPATSVGNALRRRAFVKAICVGEEGRVREEERDREREQRNA